MEIRLSSKVNDTHSFHVALELGTLRVTHLSKRTWIIGNIQLKSSTSDRINFKKQVITFFLILSLSLSLPITRTLSYVHCLFFTLPLSHFITLAHPHSHMHSHPCSGNMYQSSQILHLTPTHLPLSHTLHLFCTHLSTQSLTLSQARFS